MPKAKITKPTIEHLQCLLEAEAREKLSSNVRDLMKVVQTSLGKSSIDKHGVLTPEKVYFKAGDIDVGRSSSAIRLDDIIMQISERIFEVNIEDYIKNETEKFYKKIK